MIASFLRRSRPWLLPAAVGVALLPGCEPTAIQTSPTSVPRTPESVLEPKAPDEAKAAPDAGTPAEATPKDEPEKKPDTPATPGSEVNLVPMKWDEYLAKAVVRPEAKLVVVDAWATWCTPCMENFPHLVAMHRKYADQGLACVSLSLDFYDDPKAIAQATKFLTDQKATFLNVLLAEEQGDAFDHLDTGGVPAVFVYDPSGKEIRRFVGDDPNRPFTYEEVEEVVAKLLKGEPLPADAPGEVHAAKK